jgi:hypothetical protein
LVQRNPDVIVTHSTPGALALAVRPVIDPNGHEPEDGWQG